MFKGKYVRVTALDEGFVELCFDREGDRINKLDRGTLTEVAEAATLIAARKDVRGVLVTSGKDVFIVGADITEFGEMFKLPLADLAATIAGYNVATNAIEDLPVPTVVALNGFALGGGYELALSTDYRVMSTAAQVGLPEVKLGLFPGLGGTVRLPRVCGPQVAIDWITSGAPSRPDAALAVAAVDAVSAPEQLRETALGWLRKAAGGELDWRARRVTKKSPLAAAGLAELFAAARKRVAERAPKHQPAGLAAVEHMERSAGESREAALRLENDAFARVAKTQAADALVHVFLADQQIKKISKQHAASGRPIKCAAVLGAGIMGGGISYTSAVSGTPVIMKDVKQAQLDLGTSEARKLLARQVKNGRLKQERADAVLASITPQLDYAGFDRADIVVEAVTESIKLKHIVLSEVEGQARPDAVIATNTSSLRVDDLAVPLKRPENFVGMHFFNPVHAMPLVEVIRGAKTSPAALATVVAYALAMGKTPIVVRDGPGFLVNRILTAYMIGFLELVRDGADFARVDAVMEAFGWPMGPAYLNDVIGMDTGSHVFDVICEGFPQRLKRPGTDAARVVVERQRYGQKSGSGFYQYETDPAGKPKKSVSAEARALIAPLQPGGPRDFSDTEIVERMMLPMLAEAAWCLEDGTAGSAVEIDMALMLGLGLPQYLGGALRYADWLGLDKVVQMSERHAALGPHYVVPPGLRERAAKGQRFYA